MIESGYQYHWFTAYIRGRMSGHRLDWNRKPDFFKDYGSNLESYILPLSDFEAMSQAPLWEILDRPEIQLKPLNPAAPEFKRRDIATLLLLTSVPTARSRFEHGEIWYRSQASAGALHPLEFYLDFPGCSDLPAGLYHYDLLKPALNRLGCPDPDIAGNQNLYQNSNPDFDPGLDKKRFLFSDSSRRSATISISARFFRTSWKYRDRAYRYLLLDCGHALENLILSLKFMELEFEIELDFSDAAINNFLGLDERSEVTLAQVHFQLPEISPQTEPAPDTAVAGRREKSRKDLRKSPASGAEIFYPTLNEIQQATLLPLKKTAFSEAGKPGLSLPQSDFAESGTQELDLKDVNWQKIPSDSVQLQASLSYISSLSQRRSHRNFTQKGNLIKADLLFRLLDLLVRQSNFSPQLRPEIIFSVNNVEGFTGGFYLLDCERRSYALLTAGDRREQLAAAALDQRWVANAALQFIFFADLEAVEAQFGPRSYRYLNIEAGRLGQRLYLGATSLASGCCAVGAFYDRELAKLCMLPDNYDPLYLVAVGPLAGKE